MPMVHSYLGKIITITTDQMFQALTTDQIYTVFDSIWSLCRY